MTPPLRSAALLCALLAAPLAAQGSASFGGVVTYEKVPATRTGLDFAARSRVPAAGIKVEIVNAPDRQVLGSAFTGADGRYRLSVPMPRRGRVYLRALAEVENARVVRVSDRAELAVTSPVISVAPGQTVARDLFATDSSRIAGAFNIVSVIHRANARVRAAQPSAALPRVEVRWDTLYVGGTNFDWEDKVAFINGRRREDSDEFDDSVIAHEYGHFLMASFSREDSPGGDHSVSELLDPRLAWSEGWADFFSGVTTGSPHYVDTGATRGRQMVLVHTDLEQDVLPRERPGIWSEHSVSSALWDWYDDAAEPADSVALGFAPLWTVLSGPLRKEPDVYLLDFVDGLSRGGVQPRVLQQVLGARRIAYPAAQVRFPEALRNGAPATGAVDSRTTRRSNLWTSSAHYWFSLAESRSVTLSLKIVDARTPTRADLDLYLFDAKGTQVAASDAVNGVGDEEEITRRLAAGYYRVEVRSWSSPDDSRLTDSHAHQGTYRLVLRY
jgi:hypothetical protein